MSHQSTLTAAHSVSAKLTRGKLVRNWAIGLIGSWCIVWWLAPLVLNSILVRDPIPELRTIGLRPGDLLRWRSEGWATTRVGKYGLSGYQVVPDVPVVAIYGDSQVEGHCVDDADKICNQVVRLAGQAGDLRWDCVPLARSGADAKVWEQWLPHAEQIWHPRWHVWIVTDLSDLNLGTETAAAASDVWAAPSPAWVRAASEWNAEAAFTIARRLALDSHTGQRRQLRFLPGRVSIAEPQAPLQASTERVPLATIQRLIELNEQLQGRLVILYSPAVPEVNPRIDFETKDPMWDDLVTQLDGAIRLVDLRRDHARLWLERRRMPRGFNHGQPYSGHHNRDGNAVVAEAIVEHLLTAESIGSSRVTAKSD